VLARSPDVLRASVLRKHRLNLSPDAGEEAVVVLLGARADWVVAVLPAHAAGSAALNGAVAKRFVNDEVGKLLASTNGGCSEMAALILRINKARGEREVGPRERRAASDRHRSSSG